MVNVDLFNDTTAPVSHFEVVRKTDGVSSFLLKLFRDGEDTNIIVNATPYSISTPSGSVISGEERTQAILMAGRLCKAFI